MNYVVVLNDRSEADRDRLYLDHSRRDADYAARWYAGLQSALADLVGFPGPLSHSIDEQASALFGREVRCLLYYGPTRRRSGIPVRVLYTVLPPAEETEDAESVILLLRLLHGAQSLLSGDDTS